MTEDEKFFGRHVGGRYVLAEALGEGGMGQVFRAMDQHLARVVAIKLLRPQFSERADADQRFLREARIGAQLSHKNLVQTYDFGRDGESLFLAMEYLEGRTLAAYVQEYGRLCEREAIEIGYQISSGLAVAHAKKLVHRDLKPDNVVLVSESPLQCKVIDFGMAVLCDQNASETEENSIARLTMDGSIGGTPRYMAPEQLRGKEPIGASDVYALGCVLFELLSGAPPFDYDSLGEVAAHHLYAPIPPLECCSNEIAPVLCELVRRCLGKTPSSRPSMLQLRDRLARIRAGQPQEPEKEAVAEPMQQGLSSGLVAMHGSSSREITMALGAAGFDITTEQELPQAGALVCFGTANQELALLCAKHALVIADAEPGDIKRVAHLLRIGVTEVLLKPVRSEQLIVKLRRALRIDARSKR